MRFRGTGFTSLSRRLARSRSSIRIWRCRTGSCSRLMNHVSTSRILAATSDIPIRTSTSFRPAFSATKSTTKEISGRSCFRSLQAATEWRWMEGEPLRNTRRQGAYLRCRRQRAATDRCSRRASQCLLWWRRL